jgi:hypothetical protein
MKFKVGDRVRGQYGDKIYEGTIVKISYSGVIVDRDGWGRWSCLVREDGSVAGADGMDDGIHNLELISSTNKSTMNIKEKFALAFKQEPEKSFRKAGITNGDDLLTEDGRQIFESWLLKKHGEDFKKEVVDDLLKD